MSDYKYLRYVSAFCFLAVVFGALYWFAFHANDKNIQNDALRQEQIDVSENMPDEALYDKDDEALYDKDDEALYDKDDETLYDKDAKWREAPIFIDDIDPATITTTAKLHEVFDRFMLYSIPTVEIVNLPSDFAQNGNAELFIKAILPLTMRANEKIAEDRKFLLGLSDKIRENKALTPEETARFEELARTYDAYDRKSPAGRLTELLGKVDVVPNSLAIGQMGIQTDWGKKNVDAPFGQKEWVNGKYILKKFKTLPDAVQSFMHEINSMPQYQTFRVQRRVFRNMRGSLSARLINYLSPFEPEDPSYLLRLKGAYRTYKLGPLDNALFWQ